MTDNEIELEKLLSWRREVLTEVFGEEPGENVIQANKEYFETMPFEATFISVGVEEVGCGVVCYQHELPSPDNTSGRCAYLMNIYVRKPYRGRGYGKMIVERLIDKARANDCEKITLETTDMARNLYSLCGFKPLENMMKL